MTGSKPPNLYQPIALLCQKFPLVLIFSDICILTSVDAVLSYTVGW